MSGMTGRAAAAIRRLPCFSIRATAAASIRSGEADVCGQDPFRPADGFSAMDDICADCRTVWWRPLRQVVALRRTFPGYGVCPTDLSGESQRHRSVSVGASLEAVSYGVSRTDSALDAVRCE